MYAIRSYYEPQIAGGQRLDLATAGREVKGCPKDRRLQRDQRQTGDKANQQRPRQQRRDLVV